MVTRFRDVPFERRLYRERGKERYRFLLDGALELLLREAASKTVITLALALAAVLPYRRAVVVLGKFLPQGFSPTTLQRLVWRFGRRAEEVEDPSLRRGSGPLRQPLSAETIPEAPKATVAKGLRERDKSREGPFQVELPAIRGPYASRPWARLLKALPSPSLN